MIDSCENKVRRRKDPKIPKQRQPTELKTTTGHTIAQSKKGTERTQTQTKHNEETQ